MSEQLQVYVCSTNVEAAEAKADLELKQFATITVDQAQIFNYDAVTYAGGTRHEGPLLGKFVVIGKK